LGKSATFNEDLEGKHLKVNKARFVEKSFSEDSRRLTEALDKDVAPNRLICAPRVTEETPMLSEAFFLL